jgi:hypothetical protein
VSVQRAELRTANSDIGALGVFCGGREPDDLLHRASLRAGLDEFGTDMRRSDTLCLPSTGAATRRGGYSAGCSQRARRKADLHHWSATQRNQLPAHRDAARTRCAGAACVADDLPHPSIARDRDTQLDDVRRQICAFGRLAPESQEPIRSMLCRHRNVWKSPRPCVPQPPVRHETPGAVLSGVVRRHRPPGGISSTDVPLDVLASNVGTADPAATARRIDQHFGMAPSPAGWMPRPAAAAAAMREQLRYVHGMG